MRRLVLVVLVLCFFAQAQAQSQSQAALNGLINWTMTNSYSVYRVDSNQNGLTDYLLFEFGDGIELRVNENDTVRKTVFGNIVFKSEVTTDEGIKISTAIFFKDGSVEIDSPFHGKRKIPKKE